MINVLINGCNGKMGQTVVKSISQNNEFSVLVGIDRLDTGDNAFPVYTNIQEITEVPDVIIDFSSPAYTFLALDYAKEKNIPVVIATTGFTDEELGKIKTYTKFIPIFKSANMSYEVNIMADIVSKLASSLPDSDIEIIETHHNKKVDAPSGTALLLADSINSTLNNEMKYEYNRHSKKEKRDKKEIGIHSIRGGTEVGKHTVLFLGENESFEITHTSNSRDIFANGALKAAKFIITKGPGFYNMNDMIK